MKRLTYLTIPFLVLIAVFALTSACGGDDDDDGATTEPTQEATSEASGPGTITLTSTAITGQAEKILLVFATAGSERLGRACIPITSDDFTVPGVALTEVPEGNDPCGGDTAETTFDEGSYTLSAGVYVGGEQTPVNETTLAVDVAGDVTAELDGSALSE